MRGPGLRILGLVVALSVPGAGLARAEPGGSSAGDLELGAKLGATTGGRVTPGGLRLGGVLLYRLSTVDWFEGSLEFTAGSGRAACFRDRAGEYLCNHGALSGRAVEVGAGVRRFLRPKDHFTPYAHVRLGARISSFPGDEVRGVAVPLTVGGGVRAQVHDILTVGGGADLEAGVGWLDHDLGMQPQLGLTVHMTAEFRLD